MKKKLHSFSANYQSIFIFCFALLLNVGLINGQTEIALNGGFETGDFTDWTQFPNGTQNIITTNPSEGTYCVELNNNVAPSASLIKNANIGIGTVLAAQDVTITFDARGTLGVGAVAFAEFFSEKSGGGTSSNLILGGGPLALNADPNVWTSFSFTTTTGSDVSGGVTLQLSATTSADAGSTANMFYDNVSVITAVPPTPTCTDGIMNGDETGVDCGGPDCPACPVPSNITFSVDMTGQTFTQAYVSGSFNGWSGTANALTNTTGNIWEVTLPITDGEYEYKFTYDDWTGQEAFAQGDICTITNYTNHNRRLVIAGADQTLLTAPFSSCAESATNPGPHTVTINVDMNAYALGGSSVFINGENYNSQGLGAWCGSCNPMTDMGSGIWSATLSLEEYAYQFKITIDGWNDQEGFAPADPGTATDGTNTNRYLQVDADKTVDIAWNTPQVLNTKDFDSTIGFMVYPNPSQNVWNVKTKDQIIKTVQVFDVLGKEVMNMKPNVNDVSIDASILPKGLYFAKLTTDLGSNSVKLIKN